MTKSVLFLLTGLISASAFAKSFNCTLRGTDGSALLSGSVQSSDEIAVGNNLSVTTVKSDGQKKFSVPENTVLIFDVDSFARGVTSLNVTALDGNGKSVTTVAAYGSDEVTLLASVGNAEVSMTCELIATPVK